MSTTYNRLLAYGSSPIDGTGLGTSKSPAKAFPCIVALKLNLIYECRAKPITSNAKIARKIISSQYTDADFVFVMFTALNRYEFKTEHGWNGFTINSNQDVGMVREWLNGPAKLEYTEIYTTLQSIILAQSFLKKRNLPYLFSFDNNYLIDSYVFNNPDAYIAGLKESIEWDKFQWFDGSGFVNWARDTNLPFNDLHPNEEAQTVAANYVLSNWQDAFLL